MKVWRRNRQFVAWELATLTIALTATAVMSMGWRVELFTMSLVRQEFDARCFACLVELSRVFVDPPK